MEYTNTNLSGAGSGYVMWFGDLFDIKLFPDQKSGQHLYKRFYPSELGIYFITIVPINPFIILLSIVSIFQNLILVFQCGI